MSALESPESTLERFHQVLVDEVRDQRPEYLREPFTIAEIYQHLVPYAATRDRLGIEMNADYEDALMRLLAGQGDYLRVESEHARERMKEEIESPNPDTSLFRDFAALDVRFNPDRLPENGDREGDGQPSLEGLEPSASPEDEAPGEADVSSPVEGHAVPSPEHAVVEPIESLGPTEPGETAGEADEAEVPTADAGDAASPGTCAWCRETLPDRENLNFCPFCGTDVDVVPCPSCGEALEPSWLFCIACGTAVAEA